ncbi:hypothetical protein [Marimonas lutisalis]|uniref:hypothetical protein n=1 Tax=Marimonas lutisalis TaxID=2545756 RepID=UPI0010F9B946|nr:hypothetical protein [Marimonas lutisalis]
MSHPTMSPATPHSGPYRFTIAWIAGLAITLVHIGTAAFLWFSFRHHPAFTDDISPPEVTLPLTVACVVSIAKWFIDTRGLRKSDQQYGWPMVAFATIVIVTFLVCLPLGPYLYMTGTIAQVETLNEFYLFVESVMGGVFALLFSELFGTSDQTEQYPAPLIATSGVSGRSARFPPAPRSAIMPANKQQEQR